MSEARNIVFRLRELGEQSANGVLTSVQRQSIDGEGQALISEYNRIISVTEFNGLKLLDGTLTNLTLQAGYGTSGELTVSIGQQLPRNLGVTTSSTAADGTFQGVTSYQSSTDSHDVALGDLNGDGYLDIVVAEHNFYISSVYVHLGNGNGTFKTPVSYVTGRETQAVDVGDLNNDGKLDIVTFDDSSNTSSILLGNGNGTFKARISYGGAGEGGALIDFNADGNLDVIDGTTSAFGIRLGNGNGTLQARTLYNNGFVTSIVSGDFNGDGKLDIATSTENTRIDVRLGNGNGTFQARVSYTAGASTVDITVGDVNSDNILDIATAEVFDGKVSVFFGNGNGTFKARTSYDSPSALGVKFSDVDADGDLDIVTANSTSTGIYLNNGNGTFKARTSYLSGAETSLELGDLNGDGAKDIVFGTYSSTIQVLLGNITLSTTTTAISFLTQSSSLSAITTLSSIQTSIENELANIGSIQSRLGTALTNLQQTRENYNAAESRIVDVDVAEESANLVKHQILQNASSAILAQANQEPALLLKLLKP